MVLSVEVIESEPVYNRGMFAEDICCRSTIDPTGEAKTESRVVIVSLSESIRYVQIDLLCACNL